MSNRLYAKRRRNPSFLVRLARRIGNYRFFRSLKQGILESWRKSDLTV
jgi:hypothetical protein